MKLSTVTFMALMVNGFLDTGKYDEISMAEVKVLIEERTLFNWIRGTFEDADLSLFDDEELAVVSNALFEAAFGIDGRELRKLWVETRGLCYLNALFIELILHYVEYPARKPVDF